MMKFEEYDDAMTILSDYSGIKTNAETKRGQFRRIETCGRRIDVDD